MQKENNILDRDSKVVIAVFIATFLAVGVAITTRPNQQNEETIKQEEIIKQKADSISKNTKAINFFQKTK